MRRNSVPALAFRCLEAWRRRHAVAFVAVAVCAVAFPLAATSQSVSELSAAGLVALRSYAGQDLSRFAFTGRHRYLRPNSETLNRPAQPRVTMVAFARREPAAIKPRTVHPAIVGKPALAAQAARPALVALGGGVAGAPYLSGAPSRSLRHAYKLDIAATGMDSTVSSMRLARAIPIRHAPAADGQAAGETVGPSTIEPRNDVARPRTKARSKKRLKRHRRRPRQAVRNRRPKAKPKAKPKASGGDGAWRRRAWSANG